MRQWQQLTTSQHQQQKRSEKRKADQLVESSHDDMHEHEDKLAKGSEAEEDADEGQ